jgi:hypothetical protein
MVAFSSRELHVEVVEPVLRLIAEPGWEAVEGAYRDALRELAQGKASDAITDAATALQEALVILGATGNALGPLIKSARSGGIIAGHDHALLDVVERVATWVSADRSVNGDAHTSASSETEDAWLTIHVVGALLLRLSARKSR